MQRQLNQEARDRGIDTEHGVSQLVQHEDERKRRELLDWLSPEKHAVKQADFLEYKQLRTGKWLLEAQKFKQ